MGRLLGPLEVEGPGGRAALGGAKQRAVLAQLLLRPGHAVAVERLIAVVWGDDPGDGARHTLQVYVSNLRRALGAVAPHRTALVERAGDGYRCGLDDTEVDATLAEALALQGRGLLGRGDAAAARGALDACLALWRGPALADFPDEHWARAEARRLEELRLAALEDRIDADLALGAHGGVVAEAEALVNEHPLRERLRGQLMLALYRSGRQGDALAAYRGGRAVLRDELGLEPGPGLRALERRILAQDPSLDAPAGPSPATAATGPGQGPVLTWAGPDGQERALTLEGGGGRVCIGRLRGSDVLLDWDESVSRAHAEIVRFAGGWHVVDDGMSSNGTWVNGDRVPARRLLADGDAIRVGGTVLTFRHPAEPAGPPATRLV